VRYPREQKARTRARILTAAGRRFREKGYAAAGVDDLMSKAGLTAGGFYAHFHSKEDLFAATLGAVAPFSVRRLTEGLEGREGAEWLREVARRYLSRTHRDDKAKGCALPALAAEVGRRGPRVRAAFEAYLRGTLEGLAGKAPAGRGLTPEDRMLATVALFAGGLMLARAVGDEALSRRILRACRRLAAPEAYPEEERA